MLRGEPQPRSLPGRYPPTAGRHHQRGDRGAGHRAANFVIIATNHQDKEALERLISRPLAYLGLLASKRKVQTFTQALRQQGVSQEQLQRLHAPIGYNIGAETPEEIAISILAELLQVKNGKAGGLMQDDVRLKRDQLVVMRGSGDIATGVALRLYHAGFKVVMLDLDNQR